MKARAERMKKSLVVAFSAAAGFIGGFATKDLYDQNNSAHASEAANVPVTKVPEAKPEKFNRLIAPHLWDIYIDPLFTPVSWAVSPLPLMPLMSFSSETPKVQTIDGDKELRVVAQVPGMNEQDVKVEASEQTVTIKAHKKQEVKNNDRFESFDESFQQSVHLPVKVDADKVKATVKDGVLTVTLPKK